MDFFRLFTLLSLLVWCGYRKFVSYHCFHLVAVRRLYRHQIWLTAERKRRKMDEQTNELFFFTFGIVYMCARYDKWLNKWHRVRHEDSRDHCASITAVFNNTQQNRKWKVSFIIFCCASQHVINCITRGGSQLQSSARSKDIQMVLPK